MLVAALTLSTALGVLSASGAGSRWPRFARQALHRIVSVIACALLVAHAVTPVIDTYVNHYAPIRWIDARGAVRVRLPAAGDRPGHALARPPDRGVLTSVARRRFGHRAWFSLHLLSYAAWALGLVHGFIEGTDARTVWGLGVTVGSLLAVTAALVVRPGRHPAEQASAAPDRLLGAPADQSRPTSSRSSRAPA